LTLEELKHGGTTPLQGLFIIVRAKYLKSVSRLPITLYAALRHMLPTS